MNLRAIATAITDSVEVPRGQIWCEMAIWSKTPRARKKAEVQPHAQLAYAPGVEEPRQIEKNREAVPVTGRVGL